MLDFRSIMKKAVIGGCTVLMSVGMLSSSAAVTYACDTDEYKHFSRYQEISKTDEEIWAELNNHEIGNSEKMIRI